MHSRPVKPAPKTDAPRKGNKWPLSLDYAARKLNVSAQHIGQVLLGRRVSYGVREAYNALAAQCAANATSRRRSRRAVNASAA